MERHKGGGRKGGEEEEGEEEEEEKADKDLHEQTRKDLQGILILVKSWVWNTAYNILSIMFLKKENMNKQTYKLTNA